MKRFANTCRMLAAIVTAIILVGAAEAGTHTVQPGETLWNIAARQLGDGKRWSEIATLNNLSEPYRIESGQLLLLPGDTSAASRPFTRPLETYKPAITTRASDVKSDSDEHIVDRDAAAAITPPSSLETTHVVSAQPSSSRFAGYEPAPATYASPTLDIPQPVSQGDGVGMLTMKEAVALALTKAPEIRGAEATLRRALAERGVVSSSALPQVNATGDLRRSETFKATSALGLDEVTVGGGVTVSQALLSFGRLSNALKAADAQKAAAIASLALARNRVRARVESAFLGLLLARERATVARESLETARALERRARIRENVGEGTLFDIVRAEAERSAREARLAAADAATNGAREELAVAMGLSSSTALDVSGGIFEAIRPIDPDSAVALGLRERPDLAVLAWSLRSGEALIDFERAQGNPSVGAIASWNYTYHDYITSSPFFKGQEASNGFVGVGVTIPIFDGFRVREKVRSQQAAVDELKARQERSLLDAQREIRGIYFDLSSFQQAIESRREGTRAAREALRMSEVSFEAGRATSLDVIQASLSLSEARTAEAEAAYSYRAGLSRLIFAAGSDEVLERR